MEMVRIEERSARHQLLDLACEVSLYRVVGKPYFFDLVKRARHVGEAAAREGVPCYTPITELFTGQREKFGGGETLGWHFRRAYGSADPGVDPLRFFTVVYDNNFVTIQSRAEGGAGGEIRINKRSVNDVFGCGRCGTPQSYCRWAGDPYPQGDAARLLRMDDGESYIGQLRLEVEDLHPCQGSLYFGHADQESEQLAAFCRLEGHVHALFSENTPTLVQRNEAAMRAAAIIARASSYCFFPCSGYCFGCGGDVTLGVTDLCAAAAGTGCHLCGRTWCD